MKFVYNSVFPCGLEGEVKMLATKVRMKPDFCIKDVQI
jgi:hypothetical protein